MSDIFIERLNSQAFAPFGDLLDASSEPTMLINQGLCARHHDLTQIETLGKGARPGISIFNAQKRSLPLILDMVERHPLGSQAFVPMTHNPFLVVVAPDRRGTPGRPRAFLTVPGQGINFHAGTWHGVLCPLCQPGLFAVIDRIGPGDNLEEHWFTSPFTIRSPDQDPRHS